MMHVYRFHDSVAVNPPEGETFYLAPEEARKLWLAVQAAVKDCTARPFTESELGTVAIQADGARKN